MHGQYSYGIIHRLAARKRIPVILNAEGRMYKINKKHLHQHNEFLFLKKISIFVEKKKN